MKIKQLVLISLIVFGLGFGGVLVADYVTKGKTTDATGATGAATGTGSDQATTGGTPVVTPGGTAGSVSPTPSTATGSGSGGSSATSTAPKPATTSTAPAAASSPTPSVSTPAAPACGSAGGTCSAAQVASHNSQSNCWVIYNGGYYNVTAYVNAHPGGKSVFNSATCGHDITAYLSGSAATAGEQHQHAGSAYTALNSYYIGKVQ